MKKPRPFHYEECSDQPDDKPCICDDIAESLNEAETDAYIKEL